MDMTKIYTDADFADAIVPEGQVLIFNALDSSGKPVTRYKDSSGNFNTIACGGGTDTSDATATAADIAKGKTAYTATGKTEGTAVFGSSMTFYKCTEVFGPKTVTFLTVTGAGTADCNGRYDETGEQKNGKPVYSYTGTSGTPWYIYFTSSEYDGDYWLLHSDLSSSYPYYSYYYSNELSGTWYRGEGGSEDPTPSVAKSEETINTDQPKTWNGKKAEFDGTKFVFSDEVTEDMQYSTIKPTVGGIYTADALSRVDFIYIGFPEISCPVNPTANTYGDWTISASSVLDSPRPPYKAFTEAAKSELSDGWHSADNDQQPWIAWENTKEPVSVGKYSILFRADLVATAFELQGSNDGVDWVPIDIVDNSNRLQEIERDTDNTKGFTRHRIVFLSKSGNHVMVYRITAKCI